MPNDASSPPADGSIGHCSVRGGASVTLTFQNLLTNASVSFNWVDFSCNEVEYAVVAPGRSFQVSTFGSQYWHVRDSGRALIKEIVVTSSPSTQRASVP